MLNILRMDIYRLARSKSFYVCLLLLCALCITGCFAMWYLASDAFMETLEAATSATAEMSETSSTDPAMSGAEGSKSPAAEEASQDNGGFQITTSTPDADSEPSTSFVWTEFIGIIFVEGGGLTLLVTCCLALFFAGEFESGFIKNVLASRRGRRSYFASKSLLVVLVSILFLLVGCAVATLGSMIAGFEVTFELADSLLWLLLVALAISAYGIIILLFTFLFKTKTASLVVSLAFGTGLAFTIFSALLTLLPNLSNLANYTISGCVLAMGRGLGPDLSLGIPHITLVLLAYFVVCGALAYLSIRKKDI